MVHLRQSATVTILINCRTAEPYVIAVWGQSESNSLGYKWVEFMFNVEHTEPYTGQGKEEDKVTRFIFYGCNILNIIRLTLMLH